MKIYIKFGKPRVHLDIKVVFRDLVLDLLSANFAKSYCFLDFFFIGAGFEVFDEEGEVETAFFLIILTVFWFCTSICCVFLSVSGLILIQNPS